MGAASGLLIALQIVIGSLTVPVTSLAHDGTVRLIFAVLVICTDAALLSLHALQRVLVMSAAVAVPPARKHRS